MKHLILIIAAVIFFTQSVKAQNTAEQMQDIRKKYQIIMSDKEAGKLKQASFQPECDPPGSGEVTYYYKNEELRLIEHDITWSDHQGENRQYLVWGNQLFFVFKSEGGWMFDTGNDAANENGPISHTIDHSTESRLYFANNLPIKFLKKEFSIRSKDKEPTNPADVPNKEVDCEQSTQVLEDFNRLFSLKDTKADDFNCFWE